MASIANACLVNTMTLPIRVPVSCTVQISARSAIDGHVETKPAIFNVPVGGLTQKFNTTPFGSAFRCIDRVDITLLSVTLPLGESLTSVAFDDFKYVAYVKE